MIAILGTGLLGTGFARALLRRGEAVRVWNRTAAKARALEAEGAVVAADPADAVRGASRVHIVVSDDAAVNEVLTASRAGLSPGQLIIDHTTTSTLGAVERTSRWREYGAIYVHAPVFMGPKNALDGTGIMLLSGDRDLVARVTPLLAPMTGQVVDLGLRVDAAAAFKLLGNLLLMAFTAGFTDMLALGKAMGVEPTQIASLFEFFNPGAALPGRFQRMIECAYDQPSWELAMARKDARLMQAEADRAGVPLRMLPAFAELMDREIAAGHGHQDWTVVGKDLLPPKQTEGD